MNKDFIFSLARHALTLTGGWLVTTGLTDQATSEALAGGLMAVLALSWSYYEHVLKKKQKL